MKIPEKHLTTIAIIAALLFAVAAIILGTDNFNNKKESENLLNSLNDSIQVWRDRDSLQHAKISVIETEKAKDFTKLQTKDKEVQELQTLVKKYEKQLKNQGSATIIENITHFNISDTVYVDKFSFPDRLIIKDTVINEWVNILYTSILNMNDDTSILNFNLKVKNKYSVVIGEESQGLFKDTKPFVEVTNLNPYTETKSLRTYQVQQPKKKRFGIGPQLGVGVTGEFKPNIYLGIGINYNLIEF